MCNKADIKNKIKMNKEDIKYLIELDYQELRAVHEFLCNTMFSDYYEETLQKFFYYNYINFEEEE